MTSKPRRLPFHPAHTITNSQVLLNGNHAPEQCANYSCCNQSGFLDSPFCADCTWLLWAHLDATFPEDQKEMARQGRIEAIQQKEAEDEAMHQRAEEARAEAERKGFLTSPGMIYYLLVGDLVKIGFTVSLEQRMKSYPPNAKVLATHPGTRETERQMHHKFLHRVAEGREWFTPCAEIDQHIEEVKAQFK